MGTATTALVSMVVCHLLIAQAIVLSNVAYVQRVKRITNVLEMLQE